VLSNQQIYNFLRFCELLLLTCAQLKTIYLTTGCDDVRCILIFILGSSGFLSLSTVLERDLGMFFTCRCWVVTNLKSKWKNQFRGNAILVWHVQINTFYRCFAIYGNKTKCGGDACLIYSLLIYCLAHMLGDKQVVTSVSHHAYLVLFTFFCGK